MHNNIYIATLEDSVQIAKLIKDGWNEAYKGIINKEYLTNMNIEKISESWKNNIQEGNNNYVYKVNGEVLGVIRFGKSDDDTIEKLGEILVLYVRPDQKRNGIGTTLFTFAKNELIKMEYKKMIIWCLKGNRQGKNFYQKQGGKKIKERDFTIRGIKVREEGFLYDL